MVTYELPAIADASMLSDGANTAYGTSYPQLDVGEISPGASTRRSLVKFNISSLAGKKIEQSYLRLYDTALDYTIATGTILVYAVKPLWVEDKVTWNKYDGTTAWNTAGAGGPDTDYINTLVGSLIVSDQPSVGYVSIPLTGTAIQGWLDGSLTNNGLSLYMNGESNNAHLFYAREIGTAQHPILQVVIAESGLDLTSKIW